MKDKLPATKIALIAASPQSVIAFLNPHISFLSKKFSVQVICSDPNSIPLNSRVENIHYQKINIVRKVSLCRDIASLIELVAYFSKSKFDLVHSITPKAGLLTMVAALLCRIPIRVHTFTGQVWANKKGFSRQLLKFTDRLTALAATNLLADSESQRDYLIKQGVVSSQKIAILGHGSVCGVDLKRFCPNLKERSQIRNDLGISIESVVAIFIGRLTKDKGLFDLVRAFSIVSTELHLIIVGADEDGISEDLLSILGVTTERIHLIPHTNKPEAFMATADFLCLPSYREGFGSVIIEAAGVGIPAIASRIYGVEDAIEDGKTGFLHEPGLVSQIADLMSLYAKDSKLRTKMGERARLRASSLFSSTNVVEAKLLFYNKLLG